MSPQRLVRSPAKQGVSKTPSKCTTTEENVSKPMTRSTLTTTSKKVLPSRCGKSSNKSPAKKGPAEIVETSPKRQSQRKVSAANITGKTPPKSKRNSPIKNPNIAKKMQPKPGGGSPSTGKVKTSNTHLKSTPPGNKLRTSPKKEAKKPTLSSDGAKSPVRQMSTRSTPSSKSISAVTSPRKSGPNSSPLKTPTKSSRSSVKNSLECSPVSHIPSSRKRLLSPPASPQTTKSRRLRSNISSPLEVKSEPDSLNDLASFAEVQNSPLPQNDKLELECKEKIASGLLKLMNPIKNSVTKKSEITLPTDPASGFLNLMNPIKNSVSKKSEIALPSDPEQSGRFLRRKWFSLKSRGGFTCLRSAILSPQEIAQEVIQHTMVETPKDYQANFFSTKLMVRLSSRLPPTRARPSCEELVELINSKQPNEKLELLKESKGEGTAIRVKVERRNFSDTMSHVTNEPSKSHVDSSVSTKSPSRKGYPQVQIYKNLTKKQEKEIALKQLKNLKNC